MSNLKPSGTLERSSIDDLLGANTLEDLTSFLDEELNKQANFLIAFDATGSMYTYWGAAKTVLINALDEIKRRTPSKFAVNMVAYRDLCDGPSILEQSGLTSDIGLLKSFISSIVCKGGGDFPEAVYKALEVALQLPIARVILLGDAPSRPESPGYQQAKALGERGCPVFTLRVTSDPELAENFEQIAKLSGGKSFLLSGDPAEASDVVATILSRDRRLLKGIGGLLPYTPQTQIAKEISEQL